jgi:hypothetical protein
LGAYSGSMYPLVPTRVSVTVCVFVSLLRALAVPKSEIFASSFSVRRMFVAFTSLWINGVLKAECK